MIKDEFLRIVPKYTNDPELSDQLWDEIERAYSHKQRYYHNLVHLDHFTVTLNSVKDKFENWDTVVFAVAYHDIVYNVLKSNNEEKSAEVASKRLNEIGFPRELVERCHHMILATKRHAAEDVETDLFTDADLSILGSEPDEYARYRTQIRKEYGLFPDFVYNSGRKKVLQHFLGMTRIFKQAPFIQLESSARRNMRDELKTL
jgi:predicted metal-dependent HD superfamily phosphohydrolase